MVSYNTSDKKENNYLYSESQRECLHSQYLVRKKIIFIFYLDRREVDGTASGRKTQR